MVDYAPICSCIEEPAAADPVVLTVPELAKLLRVSLPTLYSAINRKQVPGVVRVGRVLRISRAAVIAWLEQGCASPLGVHP